MRDAAYLDFPLAEYRRRYDRVQNEMERAGLDGLLLTTRDNVEWLCGFTTVSWKVVEKRFWLLVPAGHDPLLFVDGVHIVNAEQTTCVEDIRVWGTDGKDNTSLLAAAFADLGLESGTVGAELGPVSYIRMSFGELESIRAALPNVSLMDAEELMGRAQMVRSPLEVERFARSCEITEAGVAAAFSSIRAGVTERDVLRVMVGEWLRLGADTPYNSTNHGYICVQANRHLQMSPTPVDRSLEKGDLVHVDGGAVYRGYGADFVRNASVGGPQSAAIQHLSEGTRQIVEQTEAAIKPGVTSAQIYEASAEATRDLDFEKHRRRLTNAVGGAETGYCGHGVGFQVHEYPTIAPGNDTEWVEGMCGAIEMIFGDDETGYIQWEDNFTVTADGARILTPSPKTIWVTD